MEADPKLGLYLDFNLVQNPQPIRALVVKQTQIQVYMSPLRMQHRADLYPDTYEYVKLNPDTFAPPETDSGDIPQAQWPMGLSHNRFGVGKQS
jgi:hypothetical protein